MKTLSALLLKDEPTLNPNRNLNERSALKIEQLGRTLNKGPDIRPIHFRTGVGLTDIGFPLRLPSIVIPTLRVLSRLTELGISDCKYTVYQARDFIIDSQGLDKNRSLKASLNMHKYLHKYIYDKFGSIAEKVEFDFTYTVDSIQMRDIEKFLKISNPHEMQKIVEYARSKGRDIDAAYTYASANVLCNLHSTNAHHILMGGEKERPFFKLGQAYEEAVGVEMESIPLIQSTGYIPPYYPQIHEEPYIDPDGELVEVITHSTNKYIAYDLSTL